MWEELFERPFVQVTVGSGKPIEYERIISWQNIKFHLRQSDLEMLASRFSEIGIERKKADQGVFGDPWWDFADYEEKIQTTQGNSSVLGYRFSVNRTAYELLKEAIKQSKKN